MIYGVLWVVMPSDTAVAANWQQQLQQSVGEMQQQATVAVKTVSDQVQKIVGNNDQPPTDDRERHRRLARRRGCRPPGSAGIQKNQSFRLPFFCLVAADGFEPSTFGL